MMTNQEAIRILEFMHSEMLLSFDHDRKNALSLAISALQTQKLNNSNQEVKKLNVGDMISKQAAIDLAHKLIVPNKYKYGLYNQAINNYCVEIMNLPSEEPDLQSTCDQLTTDCISRQALCEYALNQKNKSVTPNDIMRFPSAQPDVPGTNVGEMSRRFVELLAEYHDPELCTYKEYKGKPYFLIKYIENGKEYVGYGTYSPKVMSRYLREYFIEPERKTGKWIAREGKDDCFECSECHAVIEGNEVYWRNNYFCYHCGAKMEGDSDEDDKQ